MRTVAKIIEAHGGMDWLMAGNYIRLENPPFMRLVIEYIGLGPKGHPAISVAHYFEQNGDLMCDPEMVFQVTEKGWEPVSFQQDSLGVYKEAISDEFVRTRLVEELASFASMWDRNIEAQGFLDACGRGQSPLTHPDAN